VLSSRCEGFGDVIVESMAVGTPVITTDCPYGPGEIVRDDREGLLVPPGDPDALARAIVRLAQDGELRRRLAEGGLRRATDFGADRIAAEYDRLFLEVLGTSRGAVAGGE
jgi:glycosyltransferase involved in cell wall biosynthesis